MSLITPLTVLLFLSLAASSTSQGFTSNVLEDLIWEPRAAFAGGGRHHPITFANATHGFVLTGTSSTNVPTSDFWIYDAELDVWTDVSNTAAFPGVARSFGYGVASTTNCSNPKAYLGFGATASDYLTDLWEFDMTTLEWKRLAEFPGLGRRHPAMNYVQSSNVNEIHVGLGDGIGGNYNDWWAYSIDTDSWRQLPDLPGVPRHHPFYFAIGDNSYAGLGHSRAAIERDWYRWDSVVEAWSAEEEFASYGLTDTTIPSLVTTEARVAGTQFSLSGSCDDTDKLYGFVLSGDGDDHGTMVTGEFHVFDPYTEDGSVGMGTWHPLPPHPGLSRWAPGSFVLQGSSQVYFMAGYDRTAQVLYDDLWTIDLAPLFDAMAEGNTTIPGGTMAPTSTTTPGETMAPTSTASSPLDFNSGALGQSLSLIGSIVGLFLGSLLV